MQKIYLNVVSDSTGSKTYKAFHYHEDACSYLKSEYGLTDGNLGYLVNHGFYDNECGMFEIEEVELCRLTDSIKI